MSPRQSYARLLGLTGPLYLVVAFVARVPLAMSQIGTLLLVSDATGSYAAGGASAGTLAVTNAIGSPFAGALADRLGQRRVVAVQSLAGAVGLGAIVVLVTGDAPLAAVLVAAGLAGLMLPQVGPLARVRWRPLTAREPGSARLVSTAFSYEGAADEASFVLGPAVVGTLAAVLAPTGALLIAAGVLAVFGTWFALHRTAPAPRPRTVVDAGALAATATGGLAAVVVALMLAQMLLGMLFGSIQTGTTVLATQAGQPGAAGLVHALLGVGSVAAAIGTAYLPDRFSLPWRLVAAAAGLLAVSSLLLTTDSLGPVMLVTVLLGFAVAPYMITTFTVAELAVPDARVATAMTLLAGATGLGYAAGSALAGALADRARDAGGTPHLAAYAVTVSATALAVLLTTTARRRLARALADAENRDISDSPAPVACI